MDIFEKASRNKFRFPSKAGELTTEQLWDLPLTSKSGVDLNSVAVAINNELKGVTEESFVQITPNTQANTLAVKLELVKFVIADKIESGKKAAERLERAEKRRKLLDALNEKNDDAIKQMSKEDILKELEALSE